jgi:hypothetical protein
VEIKENCLEEKRYRLLEISALKEYGKYKIPIHATVTLRRI